MIQRKKLKIFCIHTGIKTGSKAIAKLRILDPVMKLYEAGMIEKPMVMDEQSKKAEQDFIREADILYFQGFLHNIFLKLLMEARDMNPNLKLVFDLDDNNFEIETTNPVFMKFCTDEYILINGKPVENTELSNNMATIAILETMIREADAIVTTQPTLAATLADKNDNIFIKPNFLSKAEWVQEHIPVRQDGLIKIGWQGGNTHIHDWLEYNDPLLEIVRKHENTALEMITTPGQYEQFMDKYPKSRVRFHTFIDYDAHPYRMNCLKPDIGFIPLKETLFNVCKSDLKFAEYALCGVPVVASNITPYKESIVHGETGFLASTEAEFKKYLNILIQDETLRRTMGEKAREWAIQHRTYENNLESIYSVFYEITKLEPWHQPEE